MPVIRSIGVVGLGAMGGGIAQLAIEAGYDTVGREVTVELADAAAQRIGHFLTRKVEKGTLGQEERDAAVALLRVTTELEALADCDLVIEAIVEEVGPNVPCSPSSIGFADQMRSWRPTRRRCP